MAKHITVRAAQPNTKHEEIEPVYLTITGCFPYSVSDEDLAETREGFKEDAERLFQALLSLPGGTIDQLLVLMLQEKASHFIVSHRKTSDYQKMEAAPEMYEACEAALTLIEDMSRFVGKMALKNYALFNEAPIALHRALAKARGESGEQNG